MVKIRILEWILVLICLYVFLPSEIIPEKSSIKRTLFDVEIVCLIKILMNLIGQVYAPWL